MIGYIFIHFYTLVFNTLETGYKKLQKDESRKTGKLLVEDG